MVKAATAMLASVLAVLFLGAAFTIPAGATELPTYDINAICARWEVNPDGCRTAETASKELIEHFLASGGRAARPYLLDFCVAEANDPTLATPLRTPYNTILLCLMRERRDWQAEKARDFRTGLRTPCEKYASVCTVEEQDAEIRVLYTGGSTDDAAFDACLSAAKAVKGGFTALAKCISDQDKPGAVAKSH